MTRVFNWAARDSDRRVTVAGLRAARGQTAVAAQVTAETEEEAAAAHDAGIEMLICRAANVAAVRRGAPEAFITAALGFADAITETEVLRTAIGALVAGADAVLTGRRLALVELLASEDIPVMGHLGFVPRKSTWVGGVRAYGKTTEEATELYRRFRRLEDAGAFAVEAELVPARLLAEIRKRTGLVYVSLGSGPDAEVLFLFSSDICGESDPLPRHGRAYGDLARLHRQIAQERRAALAAFRRDVGTGGFPAAGEVSEINDDALDGFTAQFPL